MLFINRDDHLFREDDATIVDAFTLNAVLRNQEDKKGIERRRVLESEPVLGPYVQGELLKTIGRLALSGVDPGICRGVVGDLYRIIDVTGSAFREGYRSMLADMLPAPDPEDGKLQVRQNKRGGNKNAD